MCLKITLTILFIEQNRIRILVGFILNMLPHLNLIIRASLYLEEQWVIIISSNPLGVLRKTLHTNSICCVPLQQNTIQELGTKR